MTYVADWDAKGRSNDEEESMRSQWIDKVNGKIINLSNYAFAGMSGWGGEVREDGKPSYPGALVSDGVDDSGITNRILSETDSVGCVLAMCRFYKDSPQNNEFLCFSGLTNNNVAIYRQPNGTVRGRLDSQNEKTITSTDGIYTLSDSPVLPNRNFLINYSGATGHCASILSRLILIKEQLDDAQQEFLKWKVGKEYRDWLKEKGYNYAISEMLNN